jgi:hypothetical protein
MAWFSTVLLTKMDEAVWTLGGNQACFTFGKLLHYLGVRLLMATTSGWTTNQFWDYTDASTPRNQEGITCSDPGGV